MSDPTTPEGRAELRAAAEAVGKRARWNWDRIEDKFFVHESAWNVAEISCGSYDRSSDEERANVERRIATFIAAADPETVCKLLDALDRADEQYGKAVESCRTTWLLAEKQEKEKKFWVKIANGLAVEHERNLSALARVRNLCMTVDGDWINSDFIGNTVGDIRRALDGTS